MPMRRWLGHLCGSLVLAATAPVYAQAPATAPTAAVPQQGESTLVAAPVGPLADGTRSLFAPGWNMLELAGRVSSVSGDPARWQRYEDLRDGLLFTGARVQRSTTEWSASAGADNVGWRDQRFFGEYERTGRLKIKGLWDQIPQFYSVDTRTAFASGGEGVLILPDSAQAQANRNAYLSISPQFDLRERRDIGNVRVEATPTTE